MNKTSLLRRASGLSRRNRGTSGESGTENLLSESGALRVSAFLNVVR